MLYEWREYRTVPGRMPALLARFREVTWRFFEKHGIEVIGYWESEIGGDTSSLYYLIRWRDLAHREEAWSRFAKDPEWLAAKAESEREGPIVAGITNMILRPTDFSPMK